MAIFEYSGTLKYKDKAGNLHIMKPRTTSGNVEGLAQLLAEKENSGAAATALENAKAYTDQKIEGIPTPDVSAQITAHNESQDAHQYIRGLIPTKTSQIENDSGYLTQHQNISGKLDKTGDGSKVTAAFTAATTRANIATGEKLSVLFGKIAKWLSDLGSLAFKSTVAKSDLASDVQTSLGKADSALQSVSKNDVGLDNVANERQYSSANPPPYPITSVNSKTGAVSLVKNDVGLSNVDNVRQYSANNPPPYPVTSVNSKTGAVILAKSDVGLGNVANERQYSSANPPPYPVTSVNGKTGAVTVETSSGTTYNATLSSSGWTTSGSYKKQTITVTGLKANYPVAPVVDAQLTGTDADGDTAVLNGFSAINLIQTAANQLIAYCIGDAPTVNIPLIINTWG